MADSLSAARPASRLRHFPLYPTLQVVSSYAACCDPGQALASACQGLDPAPMWLGPAAAPLFLSVVDDLIWFFMDGNLDAGYPLVGQHAPATDSEMSAIRRTRWQRPLNLLTVRQREIVAA